MRAAAVVTGVLGTGTVLVFALAGLVAPGPGPVGGSGGGDVVVVPMPTD